MQRIQLFLFPYFTGSTMKLSGYPEVLKVRAVEAKSAFPSRHDWDSYFRDAKNMNEMKPGRLIRSNNAV